MAGITMTPPRLSGVTPSSSIIIAETEPEVHAPPTMVMPPHRYLPQNPDFFNNLNRSRNPAFHGTRWANRSREIITRPTETSLWALAQELGEGAASLGLGVLSVLFAAIPIGCTCAREEVDGTEASASAESDERIDWLDRRPLVLHTETELDGDPSHGTVLFFRQVHMLPEEFLPELSELQQRRIMQEGARYQLEMLREMERLEVSHIFAEGMYPENEPEMNSSIEDDAIRYARDVFISGVPTRFEDLTRDQAATLIAMGADHLYRFRHSGSHLHPADLRNFAEEMLGEMHGPDGIRAPIGPEFERIDRIRENYAVREIRDYFEENPGTTVLLIYGMDHNFRDNFERLGFEGRLVSYRWDYEE